METYTVTWEIELDAESPEDAARQALEIQRDPFSSALVFFVQDEMGDRVMVDLFEEEEEE